MATLAPGGRITVEAVERETAKLRRKWQALDATDDDRIIEDILGPDKARNLDRFDRTQLADVLTVCRSARTISEAGRILFAVSRKQRKTTNDSDRLRKYLARFSLTWDDVAS